MSVVDHYSRRIRAIEDRARQGQVAAGLLELQGLYEEILNTGHDDLLAELCCSIGQMHSDRSDYRRALIWLDRAYSISRARGHDENLAVATGNMGRVYHVMGDLDQAIIWYERSYEIMQRIDTQLGSASVVLNLGMLYEARGEFPTALERFHRALDQFMELQHEIGLAKTYGALGDLYRETGEYAQAMTWYRKALEVYERQQNEIAMALKYAQIGMSHTEVEEYEDAIASLERALKLAEENDVLRESVIARRALADVLQRTCCLDEAYIHATKARLGAQHLDLKPEIQHCDRILGLIARDMGDPVEAEQRLRDARALSIRMELDKPRLDATTALYRLLRDDRPVEALAFLEEATDIRERMLGEQKQRRLAMLDMEHQISQERQEYERQVAEQKALQEQQRSLLTNVMPEIVADRLIRGESMIADSFTDGSVLFLDLVQFTKMASTISAQHVVHLLNAVFRECDIIIQRHGLTKIKTIGDAYLAVGGVPEPLADHDRKMAQAALEIQERLANLTIQMPEEYGQLNWDGMINELDLRIGLHCGPITAGIIGEHRIAYDVWGDTVNVAARMEQTSESGRIQVSEAFAERLRLVRGMQLVARGEIDVKGKGLMHTYWLQRAATD